MLFNDSLAQGKTDSRAGMFGAGMEALEPQKDALKILRLDADSVVLDPERPGIALKLGTYVDLDRTVLVPKLDSVSHEILEQQRELGWSRKHRWQRSAVNLCAGLLNHDAQTP